MQESVYKPQAKPRRLPADAPNILIVLIDDAGPALPSTFGGEVNTPTMDRIVKEGIAYNRFHTTAMCSPTRAALLTGRNHHRVGNGQIAELANDWDGYSGRIPRSSALVAEVLKDMAMPQVRGEVAQHARGGNHRCRPVRELAHRPRLRILLRFLAGEASQYEPNLVRNTTYVLPPKTVEEGYHLSEDLADDAGWSQRHKAFQRDKPFFMYWASGAIHGPFHIMKEWADKYKGKFDDGWDVNVSALSSARRRKAGFRPTPNLLRATKRCRPGTASPRKKDLQRRLMELGAGSPSTWMFRSGGLSTRSTSSAMAITR